MSRVTDALKEFSETIAQAIQPVVPEDGGPIPDKTLAEWRRVLTDGFDERGRWKGTAKEHFAIVNARNFMRLLDEVEMRDR